MRQAMLYRKARGLLVAIDRATSDERIDSRAHTHEHRRGRIVETRSKKPVQMQIQQGSRLATETGSFRVVISSVTLTW